MSYWGPPPGSFYAHVPLAPASQGGCWQLRDMGTGRAGDFHFSYLALSGTQTKPRQKQELQGCESLFGSVDDETELLGLRWMESTAQKEVVRKPERATRWKKKAWAAPEGKLSLQLVVSRPCRSGWQRPALVKELILASEVMCTDTEFPGSAHRRDQRTQPGKDRLGVRQTLPRISPRRKPLCFSQRF